MERNMKKIVYIFSAALASLALFSCSKMLDSVEQLGALDTDSYYANASDADANALAASMYSSAWSMYDSAKLDGSTDDFASASAYGANNQDSFNNSLYSGFYQLIYKAYLILEKMPANTAVQKQVHGEARFMIGWSYLNLIRAYKTPPYVDHVLNGDELATISNGNEDELWKLCTDNFQEAANLLPSKSGLGGQRAIGARLTKEAALAFMGKAYLYSGNKSAAASALKQVIDSGKYKLLDNFSDLYTVKADWSDEYLWEFNADDNDAAQRGSEAKITYENYVWRGENLTQPGGHHLSGFTQGFSSTMPSKGFYDFMIAHDGNSARRMGTVWTVEEAAHMFVVLSGDAYKGTPNYEGDNLAAMKAAHPGITDDQAGMRLLWTSDMAQPDLGPMQAVLPAKIYMWHSDMYPAEHNHDIFSMANYPAMRYADVLLLYAEAAGDVNSLNKVRTRAGLDPLGAYSDAALREERRAEFFHEGERFWDCLRWKTAATEFSEVGKYEYHTYANPTTYEITVSSVPVSTWVGWDNKYYTFPYSTSELAQTSIQQNPGW